MRHRQLLRRAALLCALPLLTGCMASNIGGGLFQGTGSADTSSTATEVASNASDIIPTLQSRRSALGTGDPYAQVAASVLATNAGVAQAELRAARLRSEAVAKNWLPSIGPRISLTSLGDFVANLVVEQVLFDNGRKKAERDLAKADVEVAAVVLSQDTNDRVYEALNLYLEAEQGREIARLSERAHKDMSHFKWIMNERVKGGVSDMSDLNVINHKLSEIEADLHAGEEQARTALAELNSMSDRPLNDVKGMGRISAANMSYAPLAVLKASAEKERDIAAATIERAGNLPGLSATASGGTSPTDYGLQITSDSLFDLGTGARLQAIEATSEAAQRKVAQAQEDSRRSLMGLQSKLEASVRAEQEAHVMTQQAKRNLDIFQQQYEAGQRQVMDVVGVYETWARALKAQTEHKYKAARYNLMIARDLGQLADGADI